MKYYLIVLHYKEKLWVKKVIQTVFYYTVMKQKHNRFTRATKPIKYLELSVMRNVHEKKLTKF